MDFEDTALSSFISLISSLPSSTISNLLIVGDFNINFSKASSSESPLLSDLKSFAASYSLSQIISNPTHFSPSGSPSTIDLAFVPSSFSSSHTILSPVSSSDHLSILLSTSLPSSCHKAPPFRYKRKVWIYKKANIDLMNTLLSEVSWTSLLSSSDIDECWSAFKSKFLDIMSLCIPTKLISPSPLPPWLPKSLLPKIRRRQALFRHSKSSPSLLPLYRSLQNSIYSSIKNQLSSSPDKFWSFVKSLRKSPSTVPPLFSNGSLLTSDSDKSHCLNSFFASCFNSSANPLNPIPPFSCPPLDHTFLCTEDTVLKLIMSLPTKTASGPDSISSFMLKSSAHSISLPLSILFNLSISSGLVPLDWKISSIVPIPKSSPPSSSPSNYLPISLLSLVNKLLEKHIHSILLDFSLSNNLISPLQFGFVPHRSTTNALLYSTHSIHSLLESNSSVCGVFLDLKKAFDSVPHQPLLDLLSSQNFPPLLLNWLHSYLLNRSQSVRLNGSSSSSQSVLSGVPQGSILGPLLFILYVNGITHLSLSLNCHLILYADDIFIFKPINSSHDFYNLQSDLSSVSSWLSSNFLFLNPSKCKYMFFQRSNSSFVNSLPPLLISDSPIDRVYFFKYLGVFLTPSLSFSMHISPICKKSRKVLGLIFRHFYRFSSSSSIIRLYFSLVRPILEYYSPVWSPSSSTLSSKLESVQSFALNLASKFDSDSIPSISSSHHISSLSSRRKISSLKSLFKISHNPSHFPCSSILIKYPRPPYPIRSYDPNNFLPIFSRSSSFSKSYFPSAILLWNSLDSSIKSSLSLSSFSFQVSRHINNTLP